MCVVLSTGKDTRRAGGDPQRCCHEIQARGSESRKGYQPVMRRGWQSEESYPLEERRKRLVLDVIGVDKMKNMHLERPTQDQSPGSELYRSKHP